MNAFKFSSIKTQLFITITSEPDLVINRELYSIIAKKDKDFKDALVDFIKDRVLLSIEVEIKEQSLYNIIYLLHDIIEQHGETLTLNNVLKMLAQKIAEEYIDRPKDFYDNTIFKYAKIKINEMLYRGE